MCSCLGDRNLNTSFKLVRSSPTERRVERSRSRGGKQCRCPFCASSNRLLRGESASVTKLVHPALLFDSSNTNTHVGVGRKMSSSGSLCWTPSVPLVRTSQGFQHGRHSRMCPGSISSMFLGIITGNKVSMLECTLGPASVVFKALFSAGVKLCNFPESSSIWVFFTVTHVGWLGRDPWKVTRKETEK